MKKILALSLLVSMIVFPTVTQADGSSTLGTCMVDALTGKERKRLAAWVFLSMAVHPDLAEFTKNNTEEAKIDGDKFFANLITKLLVDDCPDETNKAVSQSGPQAIEKAFELVGVVAMQELMTNEDVANSFAGPQKYIDNSRFEKLNLE